MKKVTKEELRDIILNNEDITKVDYNHLIDMACIFGCSSLTSVHLSDTSNVIDMDNLLESHERIFGLKV